MGEAIFTAATFASQGDRETALRIAEGLLKAIYVEHRTPWNQNCKIAAEDGRPYTMGNYYSNLAVWILPMTLARQDLRTFTTSGGFVERILKSAGGLKSQKMVRRIRPQKS